MATAADGEPGRPGGPGQAVGLWVGSRFALLAFVCLTCYLLGVDAEQRRTSVVRWFLDRFAWWDSVHFRRIATVGYFPPGRVCCDQAYFPGYPFLMRWTAPLAGGNTLAAGLLIALVAGAVAAAGMWHLGRLRPDGEQVGWYAASYLAVAPYGVFLSSVYSESLFLAFAVGAWWAGSRHRWWWAGLLAAAASTIRVNGLFLTAGLAVMYLLHLHTEHRRRPHPDALALLAPLAPVAGYATWLHGRTGSWDAWRKAEARGWQRQVDWPWHGLAAGWRSATSAVTPDLVISRWAELATAVAGIGLLLALVAFRRWPEAVYVGLSVAALVCATPLYSVPRVAVLWFPGYLLAAELTARSGRRWAHAAVLLVCVPLLAAVSMSFALHQWVS